MAKNSVVEIQVSLDAPAPPRVKHDSITVTVFGTQLVIDAHPPTNSNLKNACEAAIRAIEYLDKTPVTAAGINMRYHFDELPDSLVVSCKQKLDDDFADSGNIVKQSTTHKSLVFKSGSLNLSITTQPRESSGSLLLNFHRDSPISNDLIEWLQNVDEIDKEASRVLELLNVSQGDK